MSLPFLTQASECDWVASDDENEDEDEDDESNDDGDDSNSDENDDDEDDEEDEAQVPILAFLFQQISCVV